MQSVGRMRVAHLVLARGLRGSSSALCFREPSRRALATAASSNSETDKIYMIQGASRGLGLECVAQLLQREACKVVATCRTPGRATSLQQLQEQHPGRLQVFQLDVTDFDSVQRCSEQVQQHYQHLDVLFNVTGILHIPGKMAPETALSRVEYDNMVLSMQTNAIGPLLVCQQFAPLLIAAKNVRGADDERPAVIANMSARVGSITDNYLGGWYSYRASKAALNQLTKTMSLEFARRRHKVACVLLHPGTCDTDLSMPFQKNVKPEKLFSRERGALQLLGLIDDMTMEKNGSYLAWDGSAIQW